MTQEQANEKLMYYYEFLFKVLKEGVTPLELLEDIDVTAWEYAYQTLGGYGSYPNAYEDYETDFSFLYANTCQELNKIWEVLQ